ncbi:MAG: hypothetical protein KatS3mg101_0675 [Patescibacteria group bacterium]|nr:MAG: hypothetical protein KatS3mg101_0675 [Patescibacteria group bacterium]
MKRAMILMAISAVAVVLFFKLSAVAPSVRGKTSLSDLSSSLYLIGIPDGRVADVGNYESGIFVPLSGKIKVSLIPGRKFAIIDADGTDANGVTFSLPKLDTNKDGVISYNVWVRVLGRPGGRSVLNPCAYIDGAEYCSTQTSVVVRNKSLFTNVTSQLMYLYVDLDGNGSAERHYFFDQALEGYFWTYDNEGSKIALLRFTRSKMVTD